MSEIATQISGIGWGFFQQCAVAAADHKRNLPKPVLQFSAHKLPIYDRIRHIISSPCENTGTGIRGKLLRCPNQRMRGTNCTAPCVGIHEHCTVAEILVFGRETSFPTQTLQRYYMYKGAICTSHPKKWKQTWLMMFKVAIEFWSSKVTLKDFYSVTELPRYVTKSWELSALLSDTKLVGINKITTYKYGLSWNPGILVYRGFIFVCEYWLCTQSVYNTNLISSSDIYFRCMLYERGGEKKQMLKCCLLVKNTFKILTGISRENNFWVWSLQTVEVKTPRIM